MQEILSEPTLHIPVIDGRGTEWYEAVTHLVDLGKNFFVILCDKPEELHKLREDVGYLPRARKRWEILSHESALEENDLKKLLEARRHGESVFCIEMVKVPRHRPPNIKPFLAYCELRGIIGHGDTLEEAKKVCSHYSDEIRQKKEYPHSRVYEWKSDEWMPLSVTC